MVVKYLRGLALHFAGVPDYFLVKDFETVLYDAEGHKLLKPMIEALNRTNLGKSIHKRTSLIMKKVSSMSDLSDMHTVPVIEDRENEEWDEYHQYHA